MYQKHGRGAAGVGAPRNIGDFGIQALRERDARIIESLKLSKAQETERSEKQIAGQENVDRIEFGVEEDIQQLKTDYYQNRLAAVKLRGRQEGQKGKDEARMIKENAEPIIKMFQQIGGAASKVGIAALEKGLEQKLQKETQDNYENTANAQDIYVWDEISKYQFKEDATDAEKVKGLSAYLANLRIAATPKLHAGRSIGGTAMALTDSVDLIQAKAVNALIRAGITPNADNISQFLALRQKSIGKAYNLIDSNGQWKSNKHVLEFQRTWKIKGNKIALNFNNAEVQRLNKQSRDTTFTELNSDKTAENLFNSAIVWTFRPHEDNPKSFHTMADGYRETLIRAANSKTFSKRELKDMLNMPWYVTEKGPNFGKPNPKGQTIAQRYPQLRDEVLKERTTAENNWKAETNATKLEADRIDNEGVVKPLLSTYAGEDLTPLITEMTQKHGKDSVTVTNLKLLNQGSKANWSTNLQLKQLDEARKTGDHEFLLNIRHASQLTGDSRKQWNERYLPLLAPLKKSGFSSKKLTQKHEGLLARALKFESTTTGAKPETLDPAVLHADILWWEKYESLTTGKEARYVPGSADAIDATNKYIKAEIEDPNGDFAILDSGDQKVRGPAEFTRFLPGGVSWKNSPKYSISNQEYQNRVKELGAVEAVKSDGVFSKEHLRYVARQLASGKTFEPLPFTRNIPGITTQEIYQHHIDKLGLKTKLVVPTDFKSAIEKDTAYSIGLKRHIKNVRTVTGFWDVLITEEAGTRPKGPDDSNFTHRVRASVDDASNGTTTPHNDGYVSPKVPSERTGGSPDHKPGGRLSQYNSDGTPKLKFKSAETAETISFASKNGLNLLGLNMENDYYADLFKAGPAETEWLFLNGRDYGLYYVAELGVWEALE